jgi:hypothetical protein
VISERYATFTIIIYKLIFLFVFTQTSFFCQSQTKSSIGEKYKNEILSKEELIATTKKAIGYIKNENYESFKGLFILPLLEKTTDEEFTVLLRKLKSFLSNNDIPDRDEINVALSFKLRGKDTLITNKVLYRFNDSENTIMSFSFLKYYGSNKLVGINLNKNPLKSNSNDIKIIPISNFNFNIEDVESFNLYYSDKKPST